ncbi:MAG TPA: inorganic phosphate transporter [Phycisphaerae bacterium]|nr:inorganic phosphate transporter [Phycisphaerae bacterium]
MWLALALVLGAEFVNGWTDAPNAIATVVSTRVMRPIPAVIMATILNMAGAFFGTAVAITIARGILDPSAPITLAVVAAAMVAVICWSTLAWRYGIPTSESHALISGLAGAGLAAAGPRVLLWAGWQKVLLGLVFSTVLGFGLGYLFIVAVLWLCRRWTPQRVGKVFGKLQMLSAAFMAFSHGTNDGQKFIGVFVLALVLGGAYPQHLEVLDPGSTSFEAGMLVSPEQIDEAKQKLAPTDTPPDVRQHVPWWVIIVCAVTMGVGTSSGGWRIIRTMGLRLVKMEPYHGFAAETAAASAIQVATVFGIPLSTTHTINTAIMGVGSTKRFSAVRWGVAGEIVFAWMLTFPACAVMAFVVHFLLDVVGVT